MKSKTKIAAELSVPLLSLPKYSISKSEWCHILAYKPQTAKSGEIQDS